MKTLADHVYYVGSARQASDYVTVTHFLVNHIKQNYDKGQDIAKALEDLEDIDFDKIEPKMKTSAETDKDKQAIEQRQFEKAYEIEYKAFMERKTHYEDNKPKAEALLWAQCATVMKAKILARTEYESTIKGDPIKLIKAIKEHPLNYESTQY